ncbi:hypothetical protein FOYG_00481 [Fusarium oxysporum NRRL 32931]|uniref:Uncharacterized protein n=1 Tax=Fusarium oxysporum NRRL 32931 TaxID=660029 RepID=W9J7D9_FUSOX|nr:hypothetical protein FOYG_00481 [Fusarium oxysporum NRRL 32931]
MEKRNSLIGSRDMRETRPRDSRLHPKIRLSYNVGRTTRVNYCIYCNVHAARRERHCLNVTDPMLIVSIARPFGAVQASPSIINHHGMPYKPKSPSLAHSVETRGSRHPRKTGARRVSQLDVLFTT